MEFRILREKVNNINLSFFSILTKYKDSLFIAGTFLYRIIIDYLYLKIVSPLYAYSGFVLNPSLVKYILSWLITIVITLFLYLMIKQNKNSSLIIIFLNYIWFIPLQTLYSLMDLSFYFYGSAMAFWSFLTFFQFILPFIAFKPLEINIDPYYRFFSSVCIIFVFYISGKYTGFRFLTSITDVYGWRAEASSYNFPVIFSYVFSFMRTLIPILTLYAIIKKRYVLAIILVFTIYLHFSVDGMKSTFFYPLVALAGYMFYRSEYRWIIPSSLASLGIIGIAERYLLGSFNLISLFFRRVMFLPIQLSSQYFDYFTSHPLDLLRIGSFGKIGFTSPYTGEIPQMMGWHYLNVATHANTGLVGDAMFCFGLAGMLVLPLILVLCFRLLDACTEGINQRITISICVFYAIAFTNSSWSTTLLSGSFILVTLCFFFWPRSVFKP